MCDPTYSQATPVVSYSKMSLALSGSQEQPDSDVMPPNPLGQPSLTLLAAFGVKVRDFAYESTLPPIASVPRVPRQVLPGPRPLQRARRDSDGSEAEPSSQPRSMSNSRLLERKLTKPASDPSISQSHFARARAYTDLSGYGPLENTTHPLRTLSIQVPTVSPSQPNNYSNLPSSPSVSQDTYIHTPVVTPNGSLHWPQSPIDDELPVPNESSPSIGLLKSVPTPPVTQRTENNRPEASLMETSTTKSPRYVLRKRPMASPQASPRPPSRVRPSRTAAPPRRKKCRKG
jgi:hypothetical protein